jgi:AcrR family transcriptional regulator
MSIVVKHDERRQEILERSLDVFVEEGFEDTTFQKIADRCGITRTTLYVYFKNKREIFNFSLKQLLGQVESDLTEVSTRYDIKAAVKLKMIMAIVIERLEENRKLLSVVLNYLLHLAKSGNNPDYRVRKRTIRLRHILATVIINGIRAGELPEMDIRAADDLFYSLIEAAIFRLVVLGKSSARDLIVAAELAIDKLETKAS